MENDSKIGTHADRTSNDGLNRAINAEQRRATFGRDTYKVIRGASLTNYLSLGIVYEDRRIPLIVAKP